MHILASTAIAAALLLTSFAAAEDGVYIASSKGEGRVKVTGRIVDYSGRQLELETPGGRRQSFLAAQVLSVQTEYGPRHTAADAALAEGRFNEALTLYQQTLEDEPRRWVRRQIVARWVECYRALGDWRQAGESFLLLVRDDPDMLHIDCIPLAWTPTPPSVELEQAARRWLERPEPAAVLLGASHLLSTSQRGAVVQRLRQLTVNQDGRIAGLAEAQTWRVSAITASEEQLTAWIRRAEALPEQLQAGPYFVLGRAWMQRGQPQRAALALLRVAILHPQQRELAAQSLLEAGVAVKQLGQPREAARLLAEVQRAYSNTPAAAEARSRMEDTGEHE